MESQHFSPIEEYQTLISQKQKLEILLESSTEATSGLIAEGLAKASDRLSELSENQLVQNYITELVAPFEKEIEEIEGLNEFVLTGLIEASSLEQRKRAVFEKIGSNPEVLSAWSVLGKQFESTVVIAQPSETSDDTLKIIDTPEQSAEVPSHATTEINGDNTENEMRSIDLTIRGGALLIGKNGKVVTLKSRSSHHKDYSGARIKALEFLVKNQGKEFGYDELIDAVGLDSSSEEDRATWEQVRSFLAKVTYARQPIISKTGGRRYPKYGILNFNVTSLQNVLVTKPESDESVDEVTSAVASGHTSPNREKARKESIAVKFPLSNYESLIIAQVLDYHGDKLDASDHGRIPKKAISAMEKVLTSRDRHVAWANSGTASLEEMRIALIERLDEFFADDNLVLDTMSDMSDKDTRYGFFTYLCDLDGEERTELLKTLAKSVKHQQVFVDGSKFGSNIVTHVELNTGVRFNVTDHFAKDNEGAEECAPTTGEAEVSYDSQPIELHSNEVVEIEQEPSELTVEKPEVLEVPEALPTDKESSEYPSWFKESIRSEIDDAIALLEEIGLLNPEEQYLSAHAASMRHSDSRKYGTQEAVRRLEAIDLVSLKGVRKDKVGEVMLSYRDRVVMQLLNTNKQYLSNKTRRKVIVAYVDSRLNDLFGL